MNYGTAARFVDRRTRPARENDLWPIVVVPREDIERQLAMLAEGPPGADGRRECLVVHPHAVEPGRGLAPGVDVTFGVLNPGESTQPRRRNATDVTLALAGRSRAVIDGVAFDVGARDAWTTPTMSPHVLKNTCDEPFHYLYYSNAPLLQKLEILYEELDRTAQVKVDEAASTGAQRGVVGRRTKDIAPPIELKTGGGKLLTYEHLVDPDFSPSKPVMWLWDEVNAHAERVRGLGKGYTGRPLFCLYNESTGARNGTTPSLFMTFAFYPPEKVDNPHRHSSAAINYILDGSGWSIVNGVRVEWKAGDIMLSAPGWAPHGHASGPDGTTIVTVQDEPLQIAMESLLWQENLVDAPIVALGKNAGFETNLAELVNS